MKRKAKITKNCVKVVFIFWCCPVSIQNVCVMSNVHS